MAKNRFNLPLPAANDVVAQAGEALAAFDVVCVVAMGTLGEIKVEKASAATAAEVDATLAVVIDNIADGTGVIAQNFWARVRLAGVLVDVPYTGADPSVNDPVFVTDDSKLRFAAGTNRRRVGKVIRVDGANDKCDILFSGYHAGGLLEGSGTTNTIPKWTGSSAIGDSLMTVDGSGNIVFGSGAFLTSGNVKLNHTLVPIDDGATFTMADDHQGKVFLITRTNPQNPAVGRTFKLPAAPADLQAIWFLDSDGSAAASTITLDGNGKLIKGVATIAVNNAWAGGMLYFARDTWYVLGSAL